MRPLKQPRIQRASAQDPLRGLPGYALRRASAAAMAELASRLAPLRLRPTEASVLMVLEVHAGATQSDVGRLLGVQRANMAPLAARLEELGLIRRGKADGRSQSLVLTPKGSIVTAKVRRAVEDCERLTMERIPPEHRESFLAALQCLWDYVD